MNIDTFEKGWVFTDIKGIRDVKEAHSTYYLFDYNELPPIEINLDSKFNWLKKHPTYEFHDRDREFNFRKKLNELNTLALKKGILLPVSFNNFMKDPYLIRSIRSNTDCYFELSDKIESVKNGQEFHLIHFLSDSQYCSFWYLCFDNIGNHCIITSSNLYCHDEEWELELRDIEKEFGYFCAPSFSEFIYRFWIENEIWVKRYRKQGLTTIEKNYCDYYLNQ